MEYTASYNANEQIIELKLQGKITSKDVKGLIAGVLQLMEESGCLRILCDCREFELGLSIMDIYDVPKAVSEMASARGLRARFFKYAIVIRKGSEGYGFLETVFLNNMQKTRLFFDLEQAREWLMAQ